MLAPPRVATIAGHLDAAPFGRWFTLTTATLPPACCRLADGQRFVSGGCPARSTAFAERPGEPIDGYASWLDNAQFKRIRPTAASARVARPAAKSDAGRSALPNRRPTDSMIVSPATPSRQQPAPPIADIAARATFSQIMNVDAIRIVHAHGD
jgi:hypothetical protein